MSKTLAILCAILTSIALFAVVGFGHFLRIRFGVESLSAWGAYLAGCGTLALGFAAIVAGSLAYSDYRTRVIAEKSKWTLQLYEKLFENSQYKDVRRKIDYGDTDEFKALIVIDAKNGKFSDAQQPVFDQFTDYLNFFEFIAHLKEIGQLTTQDINATFDYYLKLLTKKRNPEIRTYLEKEGFESLDKLILEEYESEEQGRQS